MITFFIGVYKDQELAKRAINQIKVFYPGSPIVSISDGIQDDDYALFCSANSVIYTQGERLKTVPNGGAWTQRWMAEVLKTNSDIYIKIDPDTYIQGTVTTFPDADVFGSWANGRVNFMFFGGAVGYTKHALQTITASGLLLDPKYKDNKYGYQRWGRFLKPGETASTELVASQDLILSEVEKALVLTQAAWTAVLIESSNRVITTQQAVGYAFVHPVPITPPSTPTPNRTVVAKRKIKRTQR